MLCHLSVGATELTQMNSVCTQSVFDFRDPFETADSVYLIRFFNHTHDTCMPLRPFVVQLVYENKVRIDIVQ